MTVENTSDELIKIANDGTHRGASELMPTEPTVTSLTDVMTTRSLQSGIKKATEQRKMLTEYVREHLVKGTDYGKIGNFKKDVLFKPGQEKIFSLMGLTSRLDPDNVSLEMLGKPKGLVAYLCRVYRNGVEVAEGRGAAQIGEHGRDANSTIKIAEKRARMDACLSLGFSEFFTQDLEDPEYHTQAVPTQTVKAPALASPKQKLYLKNLMEEVSIPESAMGKVIQANGVDPTTMTTAQASKLIEQFKLGHFNDKEVDYEPVDEDASIEGEVVETVIVDDQFKKDVQLKMDELELKEADRMRIYRDVTGSPIVPKSDKDWVAVDRKLNEMVGGK